MIQGNPHAIAPSPSATSSVYTQKINEGVRVLQEALDVMQKQLEEYDSSRTSLDLSAVFALKEVEPPRRYLESVIGMAV